MNPLSCLTRIRDGHRQAAEAWREYARVVSGTSPLPEKYVNAAMHGMRAEAAVCDALADKAQLAIDSINDTKGE